MEMAYPIKIYQNERSLTINVTGEPPVMVIFLSKNNDTQKFFPHELSNIIEIRESGDLYVIPMETFEGLRPDTHVSY